MNINDLSIRERRSGIVPRKLSSVSSVSILLSSPLSHSYHYHA